MLAVRNPAKGERAAATMAGDTEVRGLDLADLASVRAFAAGWTGPADYLVNNAGIMRVPLGRTRDGFELQIGTNHLGRLDLDDLNWQHRPYRSLQAYCDSKLANLLFTLELQRRLAEAGSGVVAVAAHPGIATTNLTSHVGGIRGKLGRAFKHLFNDAEREPCRRCMRPLMTCRGLAT